MEAYVDSIIETLRLIATNDLIKFSLACKLFMNIFSQNIRSFSIDINTTDIKDEQLIFFTNIRLINLQDTKINGSGFLYLKTVDKINLDYCDKIAQKNLRYFVNVSKIRLYKLFDSLHFFKKSHSLSINYFFNNTASNNIFFLKYLKKIHDLSCTWTHNIYDMHTNLNAVHSVKNFHALIFSNSSRHFNLYYVESNT